MQMISKMNSQEQGSKSKESDGNDKVIKDASKQGGIAKLNADEDVTLEEVDAKVTMDANVQGRLEESQEKVYHLDLEHADKVLSMQETNEAEPAKVKSKDKGKEILVEEPKPLKRQAQIEMDKAFAKELEAKLNANIKCNDVVDQVKRKERQDNTVMRYQALKKKPITEAHARKNMMHYNWNQAFLERIEEEVTSQEEEVSKRKVKVLSKEQLKSKGLMKREDLEMLWKLVQERFQSSEPTNFLDEFLLNTLKTMFEKPNVEASIWRNQRGRYRLAKVKS
nr:hypothetical protein [Tanacetum cinerariifolium]